MNTRPKNELVQFVGETIGACIGGILVALIVGVFIMFAALPTALMVKRLF